MIKPFAHGLAGAAFALILRASFIGDAAAVPLQGAPMSGAFAPQVATRSIFVNGIDVSSARSIEMKGVDLLINEQGDVFINAPHYQVNEEDSYVLLSKYVRGAGNPEHKPMQPVGGPSSEVGAIPISTPGATAPSPQAAENRASPGPSDGGPALEEKAGDKGETP